MQDHLTQKEIVQFWTEYIDWPKREQGEKRFSARTLHKQGCKTVFNAACGDGFDSIQLIKAGFTVTSNELDPNFRIEAEKNVRKTGIALAFTPGYDWRTIPESLTESFDAVICLGNSLTYLHKREEQLQALKNFRRMLKPEGITIVDQRNYDYMLEDRVHILTNPQHNFRYSRRFYYCSQTIHSYPIVIEDNRVVLEYKHEQTGRTMHLELYPFRRDELRQLMKEAGFKTVTTYGDFEKERRDEVDFYQHVAHK